MFPLGEDISVVREGDEGENRDTIPPIDNDYKIKWADFKKIFKEQFVLEVAVSVVRNKWRALKFNKNQVLKFNQRVLELI